MSSAARRLTAGAQSPVQFAKSFINASRQVKRRDNSLKRVSHSVGALWRYDVTNEGIVIGQGLRRA